MSEEQRGLAGGKGGLCSRQQCLGDGAAQTAPPSSACPRNQQWS